MEPAQRQRIPTAARLFIAAIGLAGLASVAATLHGWSPEVPPRFVVCLLVALVTSGMKVTLPRVDGTISLNFVLIMFGVTELRPQEALLLAVTSAAAQNCWNKKEAINIVHVFFNTNAIALAVLAALAIYHYPWPWIPDDPEGELLRLTLAGIVYFCVNVGSVAIVTSLAEGRDVLAAVRAFCDWTFCYYLVGISVAEVVHRASLWLGWMFTMALLPPAYLIYRSVRMYFGRVEQEKAHAESMASLHLRTIEALATAIEAKDECTHDHLRRVQLYSLELAKHLGLSADEVSALQAASILHDIGKLAVPDYIISKPGKLTPQEFDRMKAHAVVGAEILEQVEFPYPVSPIVRSHHEKWDGSGYPDGLKAEEIPIGARILSAVDCLDALASDRQYRPALPLDQAMDYVSGLSARSFDPRVVEILKANYREFERLVQSTPLRNHRLSKDMVVNGGHAPDAGFERVANDRLEMPAESTAEARRQIQCIAGLAGMAAKLKHFVPYDCLALYVREQSHLKACYTSGLESETFASIEIPVGQGLSGWVVENGKGIINGNPAVEPGYLDALGQSAGLHSALSIPLGDGVDAFTGALTLYRVERDAYSLDQLHLLLAIRFDIARIVEGALKSQQAADSLLELEQSIR